MGRIEMKNATGMFTVDFQVGGELKILITLT
jgi:hypothetical protein